MSAQTKAAKETLDHAVTAFKRSKSTIRKTLDSAEPPNERTLNNRLKALEDALTALNAAHTTWVNKAALSDDQLK